MVVVKITSQLFETLLQKGNKIPKCEMTKGLPKDAKLLDVKWNHYTSIVELYFETDESRNKVVELLPEIEAQ